MTYGDSVWNGAGWIGRICADPECAVILYETAQAYPTEHEAGWAAFLQWSGEPVLDRPASDVVQKRAGTEFRTGLPVAVTEERT